MKRLYRHTFYLFLIIYSLNGCQSVKEGLTGQKKSNSDEFLIEKKNPLILPAEFDKLPEPKTLNNKDKSTNTEDTDLKKLFGKVEDINKNQTTSETSNGSLEESILKKIKNN